MEQIRICRTCKKEIVVELTREGRKNIFSILTSKEGVYFDDGNCWFCNNCWEKVKK